MFTSLILLSLSGCTVNQAILADSLTTAYAIDKGYGDEANPLLSKSALGAAVSSAAIKKGMLYASKKYAPNWCKSLARSVYASSLGAATNNGMVVAGSGNSAQVGVGAGVGAYVFNGKKAAKDYCK